MKWGIQEKPIKSHSLAYARIFAACFNWEIRPRWWAAAFLLPAVLFAVAAGFTASGIVASVYRIVARIPESEGQKMVRQVVYVVAGPTVFFGTATQLLLRKEISPLLFSLAIMALSYWSFALGLIVLDFAISF